MEKPEEVKLFLLIVEPHGRSPWHPSSRPSGATSPDKCRDAFIHGHSPCLHAEVRYGTQAWPSAAGVKRPSTEGHTCWVHPSIEEFQVITENRMEHRRSFDRGVGNALLFLFAPVRETLHGRATGNIHSKGVWRVFNLFPCQEQLVCLLLGFRCLPHWGIPLFPRSRQKQERESGSHDVDFPETRL